MLKRLSISARFSLATAALIVVIVGVITFVAITRMEQTLRQTERQQLGQVYETVTTQLAAEGSRAQSMAALVASMPQVQQAFAARDREALAQMFADGFELLKRDYAARQFQFHTPPATSFLRVHKLGKHGDDLSGFRRTVVLTNNSREPVKGLEVGVAGLGIRGIVPVLHQGEHVGSVEFGMSFGQAFFDNFKAQHGTDLALHLKRDSGFETFGSTLPGETLLGRDQLSAAMGSEALLSRTDLRGKPVAVYAQMVEDFSGERIGVLEVVADRSYFADEIASMRNTLLLIGLLGILAGIAVAVLVTRSIVAPLMRAIRSLESISEGEGDLTARLDDEGNDEMARLGRAFNKFIGRIRGTVEQVAFASARLASVVETFSSGAEHTHAGMLRQQRETEQIASAMNEMSATVHEVANNTSLAADAATKADSDTAHGKDIVGRAVKGIDDVASEVERIATVIGQVDEDSQRIGTVLDVIVGIAEQTNLLALNAAIEAARAGEQGRGFAVVADEVRTLAQRTQHSTEEIREMIESLQSSAKNAVSAIEKGRQSSHGSVDEANEAGMALDEIMNAVDTINQMNTQIATASEEQSAVADEINRNIAQISDVTNETTRESAELSQESESLVKLSEELLGLVGQFKLGEKQLVIDLERAKAAHLAWKVKLRGFLDGRAALSKEQAVSDHDCAFGKWYFGPGLEKFGHMPEMEQVRGPHAEMHGLIKKIIELKSQGRTEEAEREYEKVGPLSEQIVGLIERIKQQI
ncbi:MAG: methyl-accepting chemotaxis protein [Pseudomonadota bacterium]